MDTILAHCSALFSAHSASFVVFFIGGLMGSLTHCVGMCGAVVFAQSASQQRSGGHCAGGCGKAASLARASQWEYHFGRLISYSALGFVAAGLGRHVASYAFWPQLSALMLVGAACMFLFSAAAPRRAVACPSRRSSRLVRGVLMGFMPCGLIYAALMMASTLANPWAGAWAMALFVLGTLPVLMLSGALAQALSMKYAQAMQRIGRVMLACNGAMLLVMAGKLVG